jgi:hypothetical protein
LQLLCLASKRARLKPPAPKQQAELVFVSLHPVHKSPFASVLKVARGLEEQQALAHQVLVEPHPAANSRDEEQAVSCLNEEAYRVMLLATAGQVVAWVTRPRVHLAICVASSIAVKQMSSTKVSK